MVEGDSDHADVPSSCLYNIQRLVGHILSA